MYSTEFSRYMIRTIRNYTENCWRIFLTHFRWWITGWKNWQTMRSRSENKRLEKRLNILAIVVSVVVFLMIVIMRRFKIETGIDFGFLPPFHSSLNALASVSLIGALIAIRKRK